MREITFRGERKAPFVSIAAFVFFFAILHEGSWPTVIQDSKFVSILALFVLALQVATMSACSG